ncbi:DUF4156 domain-containing protein [Algicola sagamiensis]|uniref:DUF4156 domain-containing protein n=1 Tax=Algicola sagamiensis TaxID=163869 RepID=UPI000372A614|nr:DUF4156 domain-containing protein [Algicola sagamiensis]
MQRSSLILALSLVLSACVSAPVVLDGSNKVRFQTYTPSKHEYEFVGEISCSRGGDYRKHETNVEYCRTELKNKAYKLGANIIVLNTVTGGCPNCVIMYGNAFKSK